MHVRVRGLHKLIDPMLGYCRDVCWALLSIIKNFSWYDFLSRIILESLPCPDGVMFAAITGG